MIFPHTLEFEISSGIASTLSVSINNTECFCKTFDPGLHKESLSFEYEYEDGEENNLILNWYANGDTAAKHLIVKKLTINDTIINTLNCVYEPQIHQDWWDSLSDKERKTYEHVIYGNANSHYGWFGKVYYTYYTGKNVASTYTSNNQIDRLMNRKTEWVLENKNDAEVPWR